jgi:hypothetical protein
MNASRYLLSKFIELQLIVLNFTISFYRCDCRFDCPFGEDEEGCDNVTFSCKKDLFRCPDEMRYINISLVCDGLSDCFNSADEEPVLCSIKTPMSFNTSSSMTVDLNANLCSENEFQCVSGQCIDANLVCDGEYHCPDGTDEGAGCSKFIYFNFY